MRNIVIVNRATVVSDAIVSAFVLGSLQTQVSRDFAPIWEQDAKLGFASTPPASAEQIVILDTSDQAGALGYHETTPAGLPVGFVFAKTTLQAGEHWQATLSHELLEQILDPWCDWAVQGAWKGKSAIFAGEDCDPVENDEYKIGADPVSNFVTPAWFGMPKQFPTGAKTDFMGTLGGRAFALSKGGYVSYCTQIGRWQQAFADKTPVHQQTIDPLSRRGRRQARAKKAA